MTRLIRALGLCLLALGLVGAGSAHATMHWNVAGVPLAFSKSLEAALDETGILHFTFAGNAVLYECNKVELVGVSLETGGAVKGGNIKFSECITKINGFTNPACEPNDSGTNPGVILTSPFDGLLDLHELAGGAKDDITLFTSLVEEVIGGVKQPVWARLKMGTECPIATNFPIVGPQITLRDVTNGVSNGSELLKELSTHLVEVGPLTELWWASKTDEHKAIILGRAKVMLRSHEPWSGNPE